MFVPHHGFLNQSKAVPNGSKNGGKKQKSGPFLPPIFTGSPQEDGKNGPNGPSQIYHGKKRLEI
jgi:hypothetical protein